MSKKQMSRSEVILRKGDNVGKIMQMISTVYKSGSGVYQAVEKALRNKLTLNEVSSLHVMIMTSMRHEPDDARGEVKIDIKRRKR